jgi:glutathione S-transferase
MTMKLYLHPFSHNSRRAVAVARHLGVAFEPIVVDVPGGAHKKPEFLAINPNGMIPVLDDDGFVLSESTAIASYLAQKSKSDILPTEPKAHADVMRWVAWEQAHLNPACTTVVFENMFKRMFGGTPDAAAVKDGTARFERFAAVLDKQLEKHEFVTGKKVTLADFVCASPFTHARAAGLPIDKYTHIAKWLGRMDGVPGWKESAPPPMG